MISPLRDALGFLAIGLFACSEGASSGAPNGSASSGASGASGSAGGSAGGSTNTGGSAGTTAGVSGSAGSAAGGGLDSGAITEGGVPYFNQCGVAAPLPIDSQCAVIDAPTIANFDDYSGSNATDYGYSISATPQTVQGGIQHVGDGSETSGSVIATTMVPGVGDAGYALQFSNTNAANWGGLLMLYFPGADPSTSCLDARAYTGVEFSIKGSSPSGKFGVSVNMLDTVPPADGGSCANASSDDCKNATLELSLPPDPETWTRVRVPWGALTPGVGSDLSCVPVTGQNILRLVFQPFMNYPPPSYTYAPGPYSITLDDIQFYTDPQAVTMPLPDSGAACDLAPTIAWTASDPLIAPLSDATHELWPSRIPASCSSTIAGTCTRARFRPPVPTA